VPGVPAHVAVLHDTAFNDRGAAGPHEGVGHPGADPPDGLASCRDDRVEGGGVLALPGHAWGPAMRDPLPEGQPGHFPGRGRPPRRGARLKSTMGGRDRPGTGVPARLGARSNYGIALILNGQGAGAVPILGDVLEETERLVPPDGRPSRRPGTTGRWPRPSTAGWSICILRSPEPD
jgi:hypothetical protein